jgi:hypothetical protein
MKRTRLSIIVKEDENMTEYVAVLREDTERIEEVPLSAYIGEIQDKVQIAIQSTDNDRIKTNLSAAYHCLEAAKNEKN